jgi:hypothetical protein
MRFEEIFDALSYGFNPKQRTRTMCKHMAEEFGMKEHEKNSKLKNLIQRLSLSDFVVVEKNSNILEWRLTRVLWFRRILLHV